MTISKPKKNYHSAFTLAELLMALTVTGIVLSVVSTLAFSLGTVNDNTNDTAQKQAQLRYVTLRISELIKHARLVCSSPAYNLVIWRADDNKDRKINLNEIVYIDTGLLRNRLLLCEFNSSLNPPINLSDLKSLWTKWPLKNKYKFTETLILQCSNIQFRLDKPVPQTRFVSISFELHENGYTHNYQINAALRAWAGNLLDSSGEIVSSDDD